MKPDKHFSVQPKIANDIIRRDVKMSAFGIRKGAQEAEDTEAKRPRVSERELRNRFPSPARKPPE